jgi:hypothetical protein
MECVTTSTSSTSMTESLMRLHRLPIVPVLEINNKTEVRKWNCWLNCFLTVFFYPDVLSISEKSRVRSRKAE